MKLIESENAVGIYIIENIVNGHFYIGQAIDMRRRFNEHHSYLQRGKHDNFHLQRAYNKYGSDAFVMFMMQSCSESQLDLFEQEWIDLFWDGCNVCYNIKAQANKPPNRKGSKLTPEQLQKWSKVKMGRKFSEEHKRKIGESRKGKKRSEFSTEWRANISKAQSKTYNIKLLAPDGTVHGPIIGLKAFAEAHGLISSNLGMLIQGKISQTKGWTLVR